MERALLTGFEPFGKPYNLTIDVVREFVRRTFGNLEVVTSVLPISFADSAGHVAELIDRLTPEVVLGLGLAAKRRKLTPL